MGLPHTLVFVLAALSATSALADNTAQLRQQGVGNTASIDQLGTANTAFIEQVGNSNETAIHQGLATGLGNRIVQDNNAHASVNGSNNTLTIAQQTVNFSSADVNVEGDDNAVSLLQGHMFIEGQKNNSATVRIVGNRNNVATYQHIANQIADVGITGNDNIARISQTFSSESNQAEIDLAGNQNEAHIAQRLGGNIAGIRITGDHNFTEVDQQFASDSQATITQTGNGHRVRVFQSGIGNTATVSQQ